MNKSAPEGWEIVPLGEFCLGVRGVSYKPEDLSPAKAEHTVTLLRSNNIQSGRLVLTDVQNVNQAKVSKKQLACEGDIAVCMSNGSRRLVGKSAVFRNIPQGTKYTVGAFCSIFRPLESASSGFVAQLLSSDQFQHQVDFSLAGSAINNLKNSDVIEYQFLKPPLPEQQKIAAILSSVDGVIEKTRAQIDKLKDLKTGMMQELLTKGIGSGGVPHAEFKDSPAGRIPVSWEIKPLPEVAVNHDSKRVPIKSVDRANMQGGYRYYGASGIIDYVNNYLFDGTFILLGEDGENVLSRHLPLAFIVTGKFWVNNHAHVLKAKDGIDTNYLCEYLEFIDYKNIASGSAQPKITQNSLNAIQIPVPSLEEQQSISRALTSVDNRIRSTSRKLEQLALTKKALMQDLLTGKVRVRVNVDQKESAVA